MDRFDRIFDLHKLLSASRLPVSRQKIEEELEDLSFLHVVVKVLAPALGRVADLDLRCRMEMELESNTLAIER